MIATRAEKCAGSLGGAVAAGGCKVDSNEAHDAADAGANEQHGHKEAAGNGRSGRPHRAGKIDRQHHYQRRVAKLPVRSARQQVLDRVLACK